MYTVQIRPSQLLLIVLTVALIVVIAYREVSKYSELKRVVERNSARRFNQSLAKLSPSILSPNWNFRPKFGDQDVSNGTPQIPHIIHQVWDTDEVPKTYETWIKTWKRLHPTWEYWFWTFKDVRKLVAKYYPDNLVLYDSYQDPIFRADVMRYFVLHKFGGIYVDLDMEALLPLDNWTYHYECVVSEECYEHSYVVREQSSVNILNGFIACQPNHPFLKLAIDSLGEFARRDFGNPLEATGPFFLNAVLLQYQKNPSAGKTVTVVPPRYFFPTYDNSESDTISGKCYPSHIRKLSSKGQVVCRNLLVHSFQNQRSSDAYTDHYWIHAYMFGNEWKMSNTQKVSIMAPGIISPESKL